MFNLNSLSEAQISQRLQQETDRTFDIPSVSSPSTIHASKEQHTPTDASDFRKASVLIPFVRIDDAWHIVFIRRAESDKDRHSGQVAFVGGKAEPCDDSVVDTALRETQEEIGVDPKDVSVLGQLGNHYSVSRFQIAPIVATFSWPYDFTLDAAEVSRTFTLPLHWLADENNHEIRQRQPAEAKQAVPVVYFKEYEGELLWGATARMVLSLVQALKQN